MNNLPSRPRTRGLLAQRNSKYASENADPSLQNKATDGKLARRALGDVTNKRSTASGAAKPSLASRQPFGAVQKQAQRSQEELKKPANAYHPTKRGHPESTSAERKRVKKQSVIQSEASVNPEAEPRISHSEEEFENVIDVDVEEVSETERMSVEKSSRCVSSEVNTSSVPEESPTPFLRSLSLTSSPVVEEDPVFVSVYAQDIYQHCLASESKGMVPMYMASQKGLNVEMRRILIDWLVEVHLNFKLKPETLFLAVTILDRFLSVMSVSRSKLQLVGCGALLIASKYEDIYAPEIADFVYITKNAYTKEEVIMIEGIICQKLGFRFTYPTAFHFLQRYVKVASVYVKMESFSSEDLLEYFSVEALYFLQLSLTEYECLKYRPSVVSAACLMLAFARLELTWDGKVIEFASVDSTEVDQCANLIFRHYRKDRDSFKKGEKSLAATKYYYNKKHLLEKLAAQIF